MKPPHAIPHHIYFISAEDEELREKIDLKIWMKKGKGELKLVPAPLANVLLRVERDMANIGKHAGLVLDRLNLVRLAHGTGDTLF